MLRIQNLKRTGLSPVTFDLSPGTCSTIEGPSGAGKTLLLRAIADLDPSEGLAELEGRTRDAMSAPEWRKLVCYLPAEPGWWAETVGEHFRKREEVMPLLSRLGLDTDALDRPIRLLSTGERLRLALARALVRSPKVLLLDEPTGPLDSQATAALEELLRERQDQGAALLWVTHDPDQAIRVGGKRFYMAAGQLAPHEASNEQKVLREAGS